MNKVNFVVYSLDKNNIGGVLRVVTLLANYFSNNDICVTIYSLGKVGELAFRLDEKVRVVELTDNFCSVPELTKLPLLKKVLWVIHTFFTVYKEFFRTQNSIWITSSQIFSLMFSLFIKKNNCIVGCDHTSTIYLKNKRLNWLRNILLRRLDSMVALTMEDLDFYKTSGIRTVLIPNPVENIHFLKNRRKSFIFVGRLSKEKDPVEALRLFYESNIWKSGYDLKIYGYGDLSKELIEYIKKYNLDEFVTLINDENNTDVIYKDAVALMVTSKVEGLPMNMLEALSYGVPSIAYDVPYGPSNIICNGVNGYLIEYKDRKSYIEGMNDIVNNKISINDVYMTADKFYINKIATKWLELFISLKEN